MLTFKIDLWVDCHSRKCTGEVGARNSLLWFSSVLQYEIEMDSFGGK